MRQNFLLEMSQHWSMPHLWNQISSSIQDMQWKQKKQPEWVIREEEERERRWWKRYFNLSEVPVPSLALFLSLLSFLHLLLECRAVLRVLNKNYQRMDFRSWEVDSTGDRGDGERAEWQVGRSQTRQKNVILSQFWRGEVINILLARLSKLFSDWRKNGIRYLEKQFFSDNYPWIG